jgi:hypothetical protein
LRVVATIKTKDASHLGHVIDFEISNTNLNLRRESGRRTSTQKQESIKTASSCSKKYHIIVYFNPEVKVKFYLFSLCIYALAHSPVLT